MWTICDFTHIDEPGNPDGDPIWATDMDDDDDDINEVQSYTLAPIPAGVNTNDGVTKISVHLHGKRHDAGSGSLSVGPDLANRSPNAQTYTFPTFAYGLLSFDFTNSNGEWTHSQINAMLLNLTAPDDFQNGGIFVDKAYITLHFN